MAISNCNLCILITSCTAIDSIAASLFVLNWLSWQIVSDDKIQITILILRWGALSSSAEFSNCHDKQRFQRRYVDEWRGDFVTVWHICTRKDDRKHEKRCKIAYTWHHVSEILCMRECPAAEKCLKSIPFICHFFTQTKFLENKIYTEKTRKLRQNTQKIANFLRYYGKIHSKLPIFCVKSVKIYTGQKKITRIYSWRSWQISGMV